MGMGTLAHMMQQGNGGPPAGPKAGQLPPPPGWYRRSAEIIFGAHNLLIFQIILHYPIICHYFPIEPF